MQIVAATKEKKNLKQFTKTLYPILVIIITIEEFMGVGWFSLPFTETGSLNRGINSR